MSLINYNLNGPNYRYLNIKHNTDDQLINNQVKLHSINLNTKSNNIITIYDGEDNTGDVVAVIDCNEVRGVLQYDVILENGMFIEVTGAGTTLDVTVSYNNAQIL